jgi:hypothetical protein
MFLRINHFNDLGICAELGAYPVNGLIELDEVKFRSLPLLQNYVKQGLITVISGVTSVKMPDVVEMEEPVVAPIPARPVLKAHVKSVEVKAPEPTEEPKVKKEVVVKPVEPLETEGLSITQVKDLVGKGSMKASDALASELASASPRVKLISWLKQRE